MTTSMKIADDLYLNHESPLCVGLHTTTLPNNHILVVDVSGSMSSDLPKIREQLKRKTPKLLREQDTLSIVWFSGRDQFGVLLEAEPVATLTDLKAVETAIDRWLRPQGLTGFKQPLEEVGRLVERVAGKNPGLFSLFFMSDGYDNCWPKADILKAVEQVAGKLANATIVEYGYYADRALLTDMAAKAGGSLIFADDFDRYAPSFELAMTKAASGAPRVELDLGETIGGFAFSINYEAGELLTYAAEGGKVSVPEGTKVYWLSNTAVSKYDPTASYQSPALYAAMSLFANRMNSNVVYALLKATGDIRFIDLYSSCFGKQAYSNFVAQAQAAAFDSNLHLVDGHDPSRIPPDDAFTVMDLLTVMAEDEDNRVLLDSKDFKYSKISRGRVDSNEVITDADREAIEALQEEMKNTKDAKRMKELAAQIAEISDKPAPLKFKAAPCPEGYPISSLVFNEKRPNVGFLVRKEGTVDLSGRTVPAGLHTTQADFPTAIFRNYNVICDGLVNMERLPMRLTAGTVKALKKAGLPDRAILGFEGEDNDKARARVVKSGKDREINVTFDLKALPVINRKMVKEVSAAKLFNLEYELTEARALQKVFNTYRKEMFPPTRAANLAAIYGEEAASWLKDQGITDGGFNPKSVQAPSTDFYMGKELVISLKGLSSLPKVEDVREALEKSGKLTPSMQLMYKPVVWLEDQKSMLREADLMKGADDAKIETRRLISERAKATFAIIVGQVWPKEFSSLDEGELEITTNIGPIKGKMQLKDVEIKL